RTLPAGAGPRRARKVPRGGKEGRGAWGPRAANSQTGARLWRRFGGPLLTLSAIAASELLRETPFRLPNAPAVVLLTVLFSASQGGVRPGLLSALPAWFYLAYFFSNPGQPFHYTDENLRRVVLWMVATPAMALVVGVLQQRTERAFQTAKTNAVLHARLAERAQAESALRESASRL